ncbi:MAG: hypothetical protein CFE45_33410 [Burkholderiales bacterium PBB5]|nr:MAG: hypothetical protein CFE45_33410 [Burkholderiales bacterium PBB5]
MLIGALIDATVTAMDPVTAHLTCPPSTAACRPAGGLAVPLPAHSTSSCSVRLQCMQPLVA